MGFLKRKKKKPEKPTFEDVLNQFDEEDEEEWDPGSFLAKAMTRECLERSKKRKVDYVR